MAEIPVDAYLHAGKAPVEFRENIRQDVKARRLVRADSERAVRRARLIRHGAQRFIAESQEPGGVFEQRFPGDRQPNRFPHSIEEFLPVFLLELPDLCAHGRLRAVQFLSRAGKTALFGDFEKSD